MTDGAFCQTYGSTINNQVLEYMLENQGLDFAIGDMAKELEISRPRAYQAISEFEQRGIAKKSRIIGRTQLYMLNRDNPRAKLFQRDFRECLRLVAQEQAVETLI